MIVVQNAMREKSEEEMKKTVASLKEDEKDAVEETKKELVEHYERKMEAMKTKYHNH